MKSSYKTVLVMALSIVLSSLVDDYFLATTGQSDVSFPINSLFIAFCLFIWCKQHGRENGIAELKIYPLLCAIISFVGIPIYAYKFYGFKQGSILLAKALGVFALTIIASTLAVISLSGFYW
ncbi:hypothetical protein L2725_04645 [Shewanella corallii]|uniref:DUF2834 domain-containing protein n=1 Tax=Shewanella corallii TaxID=560080 RepID=A0ABT0N4S0_9GAMM|nr:hypothetical protein [Shewanella corallii]MCL2913075.1 hypothetical protein [Shewanella corallii]